MWIITYKISGVQHCGYTAFATKKEAQTQVKLYNKAVSKDVKVLFVPELG